MKKKLLFILGLSCGYLSAGYLENKAYSKRMEVNEAQRMRDLSEQESLLKEMIKDLKLLKKTGASKVQIRILEGKIRAKNAVIAKLKKHKPW